MYWFHCRGVRPPAVAQIRWMAYWTFRFQSRTVPSRLPLASVCPSGLNATEYDGGGAAGQGLAERAGVRGIGDVPQPDRAVGVAAGQRVPAGAERHRVHGAGAAGQGLAERAGVRGIGDVPQPDRAVGAAAGQRVPAGAERHRVHGDRCRRSGAGRAGGGARDRRRPTAGPCRRRSPLASVCPSGLNATESTAPVPPVRGWPSGRGCAGSATSHSRTVPSCCRWPACARRG